MLESLTFILFGISALYLGAEGLVAGASHLALRLGLSPLLVGLTVVSLGTSLPEAVSSLFAQVLGGRGDVALGNVIGSNIANIGLVAGIAAVIRPIKVERSVIIQEGGVMVAATLLLLLVMGLLPLGVAVGALFLLLLVAFIVWQARKGTNGNGNGKEEVSAHYASDMGKIAFGIAGLLIGGYFLVEGAVAIAKNWGISDRVIGLTVVALGTSLPELATSAVAAWRGKEELSIGNVVGSNIFNILFIVGGVALIAPITFSTSLLWSDGLVMLLFTVALTAMMWTEHLVSRMEGALLLAGYFAYTGYLFW